VKTSRPEPAADEIAGLSGVIPLTPVKRFVTWRIESSRRSSRYTFGIPFRSETK
jgi:hypothetical protein